jgi:hypothetical protein
MLIGALCGCARRLRNPFSRALLLEASDWSGYAFCSVSPARCAGSSLTCAKRIARPILRVRCSNARSTLSTQKVESINSAVPGLCCAVRNSVFLSGRQSGQCEWGFALRSSATGTGCAFCAGQGGARTAGGGHGAKRAARTCCIIVFLLIPGPGNLALITSTSKGGIAWWIGGDHGCDCG